ncbi:hypothetical protein LIER_09220 [Lithospermum erythrorhizon]|uniref:Uncharacterized protein n=1 Tax=Lithospermum erythrorhizon TaxID=34254 RepID=A0AAV3PHS0_LITER
MMLCRNENLSLGRHNLPRTPLPNNHGIKKETIKRKEKTECQSGESNEEKKVEQEQSQEVKCDDKVENTDQNIQDQDSTQEPDLDSVSHEDLQNEVTTKSVIVEGCNGRLSFSSSSEENEPISGLDKEKILKSLSSPPPTNIYIHDYGSSETEKTERTEHEARSLSEDTWISSSQLSGVNENGSTAREIHEVGEKDIMEVGFSYKIPIEREIAQDSSNFVSDIQSHEEEQLTGTSMTDHFCDSDLCNPQVPSSPPGNPTEELNINLSSSYLQAQNIDDVRSIQTLGNEYKKEYSHESDEVTGCMRSQEKLRENVEHPLEAEIHNKDTSENVIQNEETGENVDGDSPFSHNTVNNGIHGEMQNSESGSRLHLPVEGVEIAV